MKLNRLKIVNCSRIADIDIEARDNMVLIGPNGSGKTTVLLCLDMLFGMSNQQLYGVLSEGFIRVESQPLIVEATLGNLDDDELAAFPDEVDVLNGSELVVRLEACTDEGEFSVARFFPNGAGQKAPSKAQIETFRWAFLQAQSGIRNIRQGRRPIVDDAISEIDLGADESKVSDIVEQMAEMQVTETLLQSSSLEAARESLAKQLSQTPPSNLAQDDIEFIPGAAVDDDLMSDARLRVREDGRMRLVHEHPEGTRALFAMEIYDLLHKGANILAIDEPEAHLHPSSQRSLAKMLKSGDGQKILVTHSPTIAGSFEPDEIVVIRLDGNAVQPKKGFLSGDSGTLARWWIGRQLEPLTAGAVIAVEGPSDRIIVNRVSTVLGFDLDRHDVVVVETNGCGDMKVVELLFGDGGFGIPLFELVDEDAEDDAARRLSVDLSDLEGRNVFVSKKDLEDEYVQAIGAKRLWDRMKAANTFSKNVFRHCKVEPDGYPTEASLAEFIREKSNRKIPSALVASELIDESNASNMKSITRLLKAVSS